MLLGSVCARWCLGLCLRLSQRRARSAQTTDEPGARTHLRTRSQGRSFKLLLCGPPESLRGHSTPGTTCAMSSGDRSTETNLEGMIWTRTTAKDARANGWPKPQSRCNRLRTTLALDG